jgi:hypothetical protein
LSKESALIKHVDLDLIKGEISSPAMQQLASQILDTVHQVKLGKKNYKQGLVELSGYKQVIQIMALEIMRRKVPVGLREY